MYSGKKWFKKVCIMILSVALLIGGPPMNHVEASSLSFAGKVYKADKQEELAEIDLEVLFVEDGKRVDNLALADLDNGFVETDGRAYVEVGNPNGYYIQDHHQNEGSYVLQTILDSIHDGLFDLELLSCHNVLDLVNLQAIR